mmetsp:Transcript_139003/g.387698  ORF Transcript_139003/g.387698 Transcript_139003/m.387698 type:complete len:242 (+) Transcript_139003:148-873(+)|eukprot:CAMPEP_0179022214 /NCGR_PEP_ID=MMETSP0796-20121207/6291_1 /TAXON_ID=73915 /ORGANISM="Pyrodinium bahamense, Strain pbaha01" /LENGTH=241 /DNA_ID=CAMNT_0020718071 /DNA_START=107 /DNA_END=832 /DNA_ORIENTATION=+
MRSSSGPVTTAPPGTLAATLRVLLLFGLVFAVPPQRQCHEGEGHQALLFPPLPARAVILDLACEQVVLELRERAAVAVEVVNPTTTHPDHRRLVELALALALDPSGLLYDHEVADVALAPHGTLPAGEPIEAYENVSYALQLLVLRSLLLAEGRGARARYPLAPPVQRRRQALINAAGPGHDPLAVRVAGGAGVPRRAGPAVALSESCWLRGLLGARRLGLVVAVLAVIKALAIGVWTLVF